MGDGITNVVTGFPPRLVDVAVGGPPPYVVKGDVVIDVGLD